MAAPMDNKFYNDMYDSFVNNISSVATPLDTVSNIICRSKWNDRPPLPQVALSQQNGMQLPQNRYGKGAGRDHPDNQNIVLFVRQDGSFITVPAAAEGDYTGLVCRDLPALNEAGFTITLRFEVNGSSRYQPHWYLFVAQLLGYPPQDFQVSWLM